MFTLNIIIFFNIKKQTDRGIDEDTEFLVVLGTVGFFPKLTEQGWFKNS